MTFKTKVIKIGNSLGIIIPKPILVDMGLKVGDFIDMELVGHKLIIKKSKNPPGK